MITLEASKTVADDSPDHICPVGAIRDNFTSQGLIDEVKTWTEKLTEAEENIETIKRHFP